MKRVWLALAPFLFFDSAWAEEDLPKRTPDEPFDFEPKLMLNEPLGTTSLPVAAEPAEPKEAAQKLAAELERAKRSAAAGERLFRGGALAKVEAERRALKVIRLQSELENARLLAAKEEAKKLRERFAVNGTTQAQLDEAETAVNAATAAANEALAKWHQAELDAAELNLRRHRQLAAAGIASKAHVKRAEEQVARLKARNEDASVEQPRPK